MEKVHNILTLFQERLKHCKNLVTTLPWSADHTSTLVSTSQLFPFKSLSSTLSSYTQPTPVSGLENSTHTATKHTRQALEERINNSVAFLTSLTATLGRSSTPHSSLNSSFTPLPHVSPSLSLSFTSHSLTSVLANTATLSDTLAASSTKQISTFPPSTHSYDTQQHIVG